MLEFIQTLLQCYQRVLPKTPAESAHYKPYMQRVEQLLFAEALLRKQQLLSQYPDLPLQIAVIGPTQAGKSTLVNVLLNSSSANVSPLAGYTVHPQGFCHGGVSVDSCAGLQRYFGRFQQVSQTQLRKGRYDCYALTAVNSASLTLPSCVIWDTPDFDSIDAADYREGVIRTIALADIIVLTVSKEKYADQSVWDVMTALAPLKQPTLICVNKLTEGIEQLILNSLANKWQQARTDTLPQCIPLLYQKAGIGLQWPATQQTALQQLGEKVNARKNFARLPISYCQQYWQNWIAPIVAEQAAHQAWQVTIQQQIELALAQYQRDYLNHPHHYETFQSALAELLNLLEIPGIARVISGTRKLLTWPFKQLLKLGRKTHLIANEYQEIQLLHQLAEHCLIQLNERLLEKASTPELATWWQELVLILRQQRGQLLPAFEQQAQQYHEDFKQATDAAAQRLYQKLQEQPVLLNSLRTTRVTADAAIIAMTFYAGGIGIQDLVLAPAMLAVSSMLTESAIGSYVRKEEILLKQQQQQQVQLLFTTYLQQPLNNLPTRLTTQSLFNISAQQLQRAEQEFTEKRHGLRLL